jgi:hypothetical protein
MDGSSMWQGFVNVNTGAFSGWTPISGSTPSAVELGSASTPSTGFESTGYISIPATAFTTSSNTYEVYIGPYIYNQDTSPRAVRAPVQLPHGATITNVTSYWYDSVSASITGYLYRYTHTGGYSSIADLHSSGSTGYGNTEDTTIVNPVVNNNDYYYIVYINMPDGYTIDLRFYCVKIGFEYPT